MEISDSEKWIPVEKMFEKEYNKDRIDLILMIGNTVSCLSDSFFLSTYHRVIKPNTDRFSVVYKMRGTPSSIGPKTEEDYKWLRNEMGEEF